LTGDCGFEKTERGAVVAQNRTLCGEVKADLKIKSIETISNER
jgi:hypothetical protein